MLSHLFSSHYCLSLVHMSFPPHSFVLTLLQPFSCQEAQIAVSGLWLSRRTLPVQVRSLLIGLRNCTNYIIFSSVDRRVRVPPDFVDSFAFDINFLLILQWILQLEMSATGPILHRTCIILCYICQIIRESG